MGPLKTPQTIGHLAPPAYTEDVVVAGSLVIDEFRRLYDLILGEDPPLDSRLKIQLEKVQLVDSRGVEGNLLGTLHLTTTHLIFKAEDASKEIWVANNLIGSVERGPLSVAGCPITIKCKHFQVLHLLIRRDKECGDLFESLKRCSQPVNVEELLAFDHRDGNEDAKGWSRLDWTIEFTRQGVDDKWTETDFNQAYEACDTYPSRLWVPSAASNHILLGSCNFRSKGRLPALTYFHKPSGASLCRCAQPLTGFSARCMEDEKFMELIARTNDDGQQLLLVDTRPMVNAMVNKVQGKGFEDEKNYPGMRFQFFDIENIHVMRSSQAKLVEAQSRARSMADYLKGLESSGWLKHIRAILECGLFIANALAKGTSCVVHCSDGWDRTSQTVSVAELILDPFYRTVHGFEVLVEKDWLAFGHKFDDRCAHVAAMNDEAAKEISPIFSQWLDAVWQILRQFPSAFQFNERFLIHLHEHVYSCAFGTFIGNCDKDRKDLCLSRRTKSLWTHMDNHFEDYLNPFYESLLSLSTRAADVVVFSSLYNRWDEGLLPRESVDDSVAATIDHIAVLENNVTALEARIAEYRELMGKSAASSNGSSVGSRAETSDSSVDRSEDSLDVRWQPLRDVTGCSSRGCNVEFSTRGEKRLHCHKCGKIYCRRCLRSGGKERMCRGCGAGSP